jgi:hypothetical protein
MSLLFYIPRESIGPGKQAEDRKQRIEDSTEGTGCDSQGCSPWSQRLRKTELALKERDELMARNTQLIPPLQG